MAKFSYNPFTDNLDMMGTGSSPGGSATLSPYIVGPGNSDFAEPAEAVEAAKLAGYDSSNPVNIYIKPVSTMSPYLEEITGGDGINLVGFVNCNPDAGYQDGVTGNSVTIQAVYIHPDGAKTTLEGINFAESILVEGGELFFNNCSFDNEVVLNSTSTISLYFNNCSFNKETGSIMSNFESATEVNMKFINCRSASSGTSTLPMGEAVLNLSMDSCAFSGPFSISTTNIANINLNNYQDLSSVDNPTLFELDVAEDSVFVANGVITRRGIGSFSEGMKISINNSSFHMGNTFFSDNTQFSSGININNQEFWESGVYMGARTGYNSSNANQAQGFIQTTDDTPTNIFSRELLNEKAIVLQGIIIGTNSDKTQGCTGNFCAGIRKEEDQPPEFIGTPTVNVQSDSTATFQITFENFDPGFSMVHLTVTGVDAETYDWVCYCDYVHQ